MQVTETFRPDSSQAWRSWLAKNHKVKTEVWVAMYRKDTGKQVVVYDQVVEEALCFGWIDGILKKLDDERFAIRFSPRKPGSNLSSANRELITKLIAEKRMTQAGLNAVAHAYKK